MTEALQEAHPAHQATTGAAVHPHRAAQASAADQATAGEVPAEDTAEEARAEAEAHREAEDKDNSNNRTL